MAINLPELSAKISGLHGTHRSQYVAAATTEVIQSITAILSQSSSRELSDKYWCLHDKDNDVKLPPGVPAEVVYDISEICAPFVDSEEVKPLVEALLHCNIGAALPGSNKTGLSLAFVSSVQDKELSYSSKLALWTKDIICEWLDNLQKRQVVVTTVRLVTHSENTYSDLDIEELLTRSHLPQACCQQSQLFYHIQDLLKTELLGSGGADSVVKFIKAFHKLFRKELTCPQSKQLAPSLLCSYYPTHLHSLLHLMSTTLGSELSDTSQLWSHINNYLHSAGNTHSSRADVWLLLVEFDCWRDGDAQRLQLSHEYTAT